MDGGEEEGEPCARAVENEGEDEESGSVPAAPEKSMA